MATSAGRNSATSTWSPGRMTSGAVASSGPSRCNIARTGATITRGGGGSAGSGAAVSAWSTARRRPIVSVSGLTRSKGRVSQAGSTVTGVASAPTTGPPATPASWASPFSAAIRQDKSSPRRSASNPVAVITSSGDRSVNAANAAATTAWAASGTATVASAAPTSTASAGSLRRRRGMAERLPALPCRGLRGLR